MSTEPKHPNNGLVPDNVFMSKREQFAAVAMQALISKTDGSAAAPQVAIAAFAYADAMLMYIDQEQRDTVTRRNQ